jgi:SAM-dependent methyltransferase
MRPPFFIVIFTFPKKSGTIKILMTLVVMIFLILLSVLLVILSVVGFVALTLDFIGKLTTDAPFVPARKRVIGPLLQLLDLKPNDVFYDLGCGDGRIIIAVAQKFPQTKVVGVELGLLPYLTTRIKTRKYHNIEVRFNNIFKEPLGQATCIYAYLYPKVLDRLLPKLNRELRTGTTFISCDFAFSEKTAYQEIPLRHENDKLSKRLLVYTF